MFRPYRDSFILLAILVSLCCPLISQAQPVRDRLLGDVEITPVDQQYVVRVNMTFPVRYVRHFPLDVGKEVRIQLDPIAINQQDREALFKRESASPPPGNPAFVSEVLFEGDIAGGPYLSLLFSQPVHYQVKQGDDYRSLLILVARTDIGTTPTTVTTDKVAQGVLKEAQQAMDSGDFTRAVQLYTKLSEHQEGAVRRTAQELLGLARERNGQLAHAKAEYRRYLELYPEGEGAVRVRARLDAILSGATVMTKAGQPAEAPGWQADFYGGLSQFYDREEIRTEQDARTVDRSSLDTNFDMTWRLQNQAFDIRTVLIGGHEEDFLAADDSQTRINSLYLDVKAKRAGVSTRLGRQSKSSGGLLGRFDGGVLSYHFTPKAAISLMGGFPVSSSADGIETDKYFYGAALDLTLLAEHWDLTTYVLQQEADGYIDRQAAGAELRFKHRNGSMFALVDYDLHYSELNAALFSASLYFPDRSILTLSGDYRNSPLLATSNALIGQTVTTLDELGQLFTEAEIKQLALDRTAVSKSATVSLTRPVSEKLQVAADVTWTRLEGTQASGGVDAIEATEDEYYYALQLIGSSLIKEGDLASLGVRYADTTRYDSYAATINTRFPLNQQWRINPKLTVDYREHKVEEEEQWSVRPSLRIDLRVKRAWRFEIEGGYEWASETVAGVDEDSSGYFFTIGYSWDF